MAILIDIGILWFLLLIWKKLNDLVEIAKE